MNTTLLTLFLWCLVHVSVEGYGFEPAIVRNNAYNVNHYNSTVIHSMYQSVNKTMCNLMDVANQINYAIYNLSNAANDVGIQAMEKSNNSLTILTKKVHHAIAKATINSTNVVNLECIRKNQNKANGIVASTMDSVTTCISGLIENLLNLMRNSSALSTTAVDFALMLSDLSCDCFMDTNPNNKTDIIHVEKCLTSLVHYYTMEGIEVIKEISAQINDDVMTLKMIPMRSSACTTSDLANATSQIGIITMGIPNCVNEQTRK